MGHPVLSLTESQWKLRQHHDQNFQMEGILYLDWYSRIGGNMKIRLGKPALNNFKAYGWQK